MIVDSGRSVGAVVRVVVPFRVASLVVDMFGVNADARPTQRDNIFRGDLPAVSEVDPGEGRAVGGEGPGCIAGDVGAVVEVNLSEGGAVGCEGDDRGVSDVGAAVEANGCEGLDKVI